MFPGLTVKFTDSELRTFNLLISAILTESLNNDDKIYRYAVKDVFGEITLKVHRKLIANRAKHSFTFKPIEVQLLFVELYDLSNKYADNSFEHYVYLKIMKAIDQFQINLPNVSQH